MFCASAIFKRTEPIITSGAEERLAIVFDLYQKGAITQEEYEERKRIILDTK